MPRRSTLYPCMWQPGGPRARSRCDLHGVELAGSSSGGATHLSPGTSQNHGRVDPRADRCRTSAKADHHRMEKRAVRRDGLDRRLPPDGADDGTKLRPMRSTVPFALPFVMSDRAMAVPMPPTATCAATPIGR